MKKWQKKAIEEIMDNFDFEKVHNAMVFMNWTWSFNKTPTVDELKETAHHLLCEICEGDSEFIETGGFFIYIFRKEHILRLLFIIESASYE